MKFLKFVLGLLALSTLALTQRLVPPPFNAQQLGGYNSLCLASSQCNQKQGLYCVPSSPNSPGNQFKCRCPTNTTIFDEARNRCVGRIGENCAYESNATYCPMHSFCSHQDPRSPSLYYYESKCFCDPNYIPNTEGGCSPAAKYNEPCNHSDKRCDILAGLQCDPDTSTCQCEFDTDQYYDKDKERCVSFINKKCSTYYGCVENAKCDGLAPAKSRTFVSASQARKPASKDSAVIQQSSQPIKRQFSTDGRLIGKCVCEYGFSPSNNGRCMASYRSVCSALSECNPLDSLECQDGSCNCKNPLHMYWDFKLHKCRVLVHGKCTGKPPGNTEECVDNAECENGFCVCKRSYSKTPHRKCMRSYQETCNENEKCNFYAGLVCKSQEQQCRCMDDSLTYNENLKACVSRVDMPCGKIGQAGDYGKEPYYVGCEPQTVCKQEVDGDLTTSYCRRV